MTIKEVYQYITSWEARERTYKLRAFEDEKEAKKYKANNFDFVCFSGTFSYRNADNLIEHSELMCLDYDHVGNAQQIGELREKLLQDPMLDTELLFTSPSGDGLKQVVSIDLTMGDHLKWFVVLKTYIKAQYNIEVDKACSDVCRACFLPHDVNCYVNPEIFNEPDVCPF